MSCYTSTAISRSVSVCSLRSVKLTPNQERRVADVKTPSGSASRTLTEREIGTIAVALELLAAEPNSTRLQDARVASSYTDTLLDDEQMRSLGSELLTTRNVTLWNNNRRNA